MPQPRYERLSGAPIDVRTAQQSCVILRDVGLTLPEEAKELSAGKLEDRIETSHLYHSNVS
jgi:hypothetical protein